MPAPRRDLTNRLQRLEDANRTHLWNFTLPDGRTASVPVETVLSVLTEGLPILYGPHEDYPQASRDLLLIAQADAAAETSVVGAAVVKVARRVREKFEAGRED